MEGDRRHLETFELFPKRAALSVWNWICTTAGLQYLLEMADYREGDRVYLFVVSSNSLYTEHERTVLMTKLCSCQRGIAADVLEDVKPDLGTGRL